jgi:hypothetical protein
MGGASSGGSDNDVSGAEAVATGGTTYNSRKTKTVNKEIAKTNQDNRESRKSIIQKIAENSPAGRVVGKIKNSKFVKDHNYNRRLKFATDKGLRTSGMSRDFILSDGFKNQLDGMGYSDQPGNVGGDNDRGNNKTILSTAPVRNVTAEAPTSMEVAQAQSTDSTEYSASEKKIQTNKKGRKENLLTSAQGLGKNNLIIKKNKLGAA